jgi:hypothetical protein
MHDLGYELPRKSIPRTSVNKGKKKEGRVLFYTPALRPTARLLSYSITPSSIHSLRRLLRVLSEQDSSAILS